MEQTKINFRKILLALGVSSLLLVVFAFGLYSYFDAFFIRWEYIIPPVLAIYYLSVQPYLNYADAKTYFKSGAKVGSLLALIILAINAFYELMTYGWEGFSENPIRTAISYTLFLLSYAVISGISHYLFNKNVDPKRKDIWHRQYMFASLLIGAFSFVIISLFLENYEIDPQQRFAFTVLLPAVVTAFMSVKMHHLHTKDLLGAMSLGGIAGFLQGLVTVTFMVFGLMYLYLFTSLLDSIASDGGDLLFLIMTTPFLVIIYTVIGGATGLGMKVLKAVL